MIRKITNVYHMRMIPSTVNTVTYSLVCTCSVDKFSVDKF